MILRAKNKFCKSKKKLGEIKYSYPILTDKREVCPTILRSSIPHIKIPRTYRSPVPLLIDKHRIIVIEPLRHSRWHRETQNIPRNIRIRRQHKWYPRNIERQTCWTEEEHCPIGCIEPDISCCILLEFVRIFNIDAEYRVVAFTKFWIICAGVNLHRIIP